MKRLVIRTIVVGATLLAAAACAGDPTESLRTGPSILSLSPNVMFIAQDSTKSLEVTVRDQQLNPVPLPVSVSSRDPAVFTVAADTGAPSVDGARFTFVVSAVAPGQSRLIVTAGGLTDSATITVLPTAFAGALSSTTPQGGSTLTIHSTSLLKFNTDSVKVTFGGAHVAPIVFKSADSVKVLVPFSPAAKLTVAGINVTYVPGLLVSLPTSATVTQTGNFWAASNGWQTAPDISSLVPAAASSSRMIAGTVPANAAVCPEVVLGFGSTGPCMMFKFVLAAPTTLNFTTDWEGTAAAPDVDIYACADSTIANFGSACFEDGGAGATGSKPQATGNHAYAAGTYWFVIEIYDGAPSPNYNVTISRP
jgi:hypothetical protein